MTKPILLIAYLAVISMLQHHSYAESSEPVNSGSAVSREEKIRQWAQTAAKAGATRDARKNQFAQDVLQKLRKKGGLAQPGELLSRPKNLDAFPYPLGDFEEAATGSLPFSMNKTYYLVVARKDSSKFWLIVAPDFGELQFYSGDISLLQSKSE